MKDIKTINYQEEYAEKMENYKELISEYEELINSERYDKIINTMPFEFLNATHLCEKLSLYEKLEKKPRMHFNSPEEAKVFYKNLITFSKNTKNLLDDAFFISTVGQMAEKINEYSLSCPVLGPSFFIEPNHEIISLAEKCLYEIPRYPKMLTKKFRWNYIESIIISLDKEDLELFVESKIIKPEDLDNISLTETVNNYNEKIKYLCSLLNHSELAIATYKLKLKGVTFSNDDGSSRQENLTELKQYTEEHADEEISLTVECYTYTPEIGNPEPAIKIAWNGKVIGNIAKDAVSEIMEKFKNPQYTAKLRNVSGGEDGMNLGCWIDLKIIAPEYTNIKNESIEQIQTTEM